MIEYRERAWAEISLDALTCNMHRIAQALSPSTQFCAVVKADAYGHGEAFVCRTLYKNGIRFYAVSTIEEAIRVRRLCPEAEILILGYTPPECAPLLAEKNILQTLVSGEYAAGLSRFASPGSPVRCHIKLDTGMGRIGVQAGNREACLKEIKEMAALPGLSIEGMFTHFAAADESDADNRAYTDRQEKWLFETAALAETEAGLHLRHIHCMNSAAICYRNTPKSTLARAGIILYGLMPNAALPVPFDLHPVLSLRSRISHIKTVKPGTDISYGRTYRAEKPRRIATVTIGYADGYSRLLSGRGQVLICGVRCPIAGRICMDQLMADITDVPDARIGQIVTLIGRDGEDCITADELAGWYGTIGYEVVCGISKRVPRKFIENGSVIHEDSLI